MWTLAKTEAAKASASFAGAAPNSTGASLWFGRAARFRGCASGVGRTAGAPTAGGRGIGDVVVAGAGQQQGAAVAEHFEAIGDFDELLLLLGSEAWLGYSAW